MSDNASNTMNALSVEELRRRNESMIENIGALRFSIARIERLDGYRSLLRDLLKDCRIVIEAHGNRGLVKRIDIALKETEE